MIVDAGGARLVADASDVGRQVAVGTLFWLDIFSADASVHSAHLNQAGLEGVDIAWALRFGQTGRMNIGPQRLRAATWIADRGGNLVELHLIGRQNCIITVWSGDAKELDEIRLQFAERVAGLEDSLYQAAGIVLQLLLSTLDSVIESVDASLDDLRLCVDGRDDPSDFVSLSRRVRALQSIVAGFGRYSNAVRTATVGIESLPGMGARGAEELNDYVEQVEDIEEQLYERRRWMSDIMHDFATNIAQKQGEQINRLTLVSLIFLPVTALTGFFGMNFDWLNRAMASREAFLLLGLVLPSLCVIMTLVWLMRQGLIRISFRAPTTRTGRRDDETAPARRSSNAETAIGRSDVDVALRPRERSVMRFPPG
jgi:Mg2+ and Co2+ transporter CorA